MGGEGNPAPLEGRFFSAMAGLCPGWPGGRYVCAFSGGGDSTALLALMAAFLPAERLLAAHLDHGLREGSGLEAQAAAETAGSLGVRCVLGRAGVADLARERGKGLEEAARSARYRFLARVSREWPGDWVVTAHQAEDQAETVIMKLARGAGPGALVGIGARAALGDGATVVRPLLGESRPGLMAYLAERGLGFVTDPSNQDERFGRNLVRRRILPELERLNPAYLAAFGRAAAIAAGEEEFWEAHLDALMARLGFKGDRGWYAVLAEGLAGLGPAERRRVLGRLMRLVRADKPGGGEPVSLAGVEAAMAFLENPGAGGLDVPGGRRVELRGRYAYVGPASRLGAKKGG